MKQIDNVDADCVHVIGSKSSLGAAELIQLLLYQDGIAPVGEFAWWLLIAFQFS
jgi:hypothetical protein